LWNRSSRSPSPEGKAQGAAGAGAGAPPARTPEEEALLDRLAELTVRHRMTVPAIFFLESVKPLSFVGSQALHFFEPMVNAFFQVRDYERFAVLMERRESLEALLVKIEERDDTARHEEKERRRQHRAERAARKGGKEPS
jgi:hypothetical protein